jgi:hypothetical protein
MELCLAEKWISYHTCAVAFSELEAALDPALFGYYRSLHF